MASEQSRRAKLSSVRGRGVEESTPEAPVLTEPADGERQKEESQHPHDAPQDVVALLVRLVARLLGFGALDHGHGGGGNVVNEEDVGEMTASLA